MSGQDSMNELFRDAINNIHKQLEYITKSLTSIRKNQETDFKIIELMNKQFTQEISELKAEIKSMKESINNIQQEQS